jgi:hypothetical protein
MTNAVNLASAAGTGFAFRNRIINGDMRIDQRFSGAATSIGVGDGVFFQPDRWRFQKSSASYGSTAQVSSVAPEGFTSSLLVTVTSAFTPAAGDYFTIGQKIEGPNYSDFQYGTSVAKTTTVSFWVRSSVVGSYAASLSNANVYNRFIVKTFTINAANTWEYKTLTFPGDTTGTWGISTSDSLYLRIDLGSGSSFNASAADVWSAAGFRLSSNVNFGANAGATFYLTGVQLEVGSAATPFERRPLGLEETLCQRYYQKSALVEYHMCPAPGATYASTYPVHFPTYMRTTPTLGFSYVTSNAIGSYTSAIFSSNSGFVHFISASVSTNAYMSFYWTGSAEI